MKTFEMLLSVLHNLNQMNRQHNEDREESRNFSAEYAKDRKEFRNFKKTYEINREEEIGPTILSSGRIFLSHKKSAISRAIYVNSRKTG